MCFHFVATFANFQLFPLHPVHRRAACVLPEQRLPLPAHLQPALLPLERLQKRLGVEERLDLLDLQLVGHGDAAQAEHFHCLQRKI